MSKEFKYVNLSISLAHVLVHLLREVWSQFTALYLSAPIRIESSWQTAASFVRHSFKVVGLHMRIKSWVHVGMV